MFKCKMSDDFFKELTTHVMSNSADLSDLCDQFDNLDITLVDRHELVHKIKRFSIKAKDIPFESKVVLIDFLKHAYYSLFDDQLPFKNNVPSLEFFFEYATRIGKERDEMMEYCRHLFSEGMEYGDAQILVDLLPRGRLRESVMTFLRKRNTKINKTDDLIFFNDRQGVHNDGIASSVSKLLTLMNTNDISDEFDQHVAAFKMKAGQLSPQQELSLQTIDRDTSKCNLRNCFCHVWSKIVNHEHETELINRLLEELTEMSGKCLSGHLSRLVNVFSGFDSNFQIKVDYDDEIKAAVIARFRARINTLPEEEAAIYLENMVETDKTPEYVMFKENARHEIYDELKEEYKPLFNIDFTEQSFDSAFAAAMNAV